MKIRWNTETFIKYCSNIYEYDYGKTEYIKNDVHIKVICKLHGEFLILPKNHLNGDGCPTCCKMNNIDTQKEKFINKSKEIHKDIFDYSLVNYINNITKVKLICKNGHITEQTPLSNLHGNGCSICSGYNKKDNNYFIDKCSEIHDNKYNYSLVDYTSNKHKVKIICPVHGVFEQRAINHMLGCGCKKCNDSQGEKYISKILNDNNIKYISQKNFECCKYKNKLYFDFYLPNYNICIEYNGKQHYQPIKYWGGEDMFDKIKIRDKIKENYCNKNNIELVRIKYDENIEEKMNKIFNI